MKFKEEAEKYLNKNLGNIRQSKPGQIFSVLKRLGAQPGEGSESNIFSLREHETECLSPDQSAERIAEHFASISQEFPPLNVNLLPSRVKDKILSCDSKPPQISEYDTYCNLRSTKKPKSGVSNDLPKELLKEFSPELASPVHKILQNIFNSGEWPNWKLEHVIPIGKVPIPECEDDLRPISLTPFFRSESSSELLDVKVKVKVKAKKLRNKLSWECHTGGYKLS